MDFNQQQNFETLMSKLTDNKIVLDRLIQSTKNETIGRVRLIENITNIQRRISDSNAIVGEILSLELDEVLITMQLSPIMNYLHDVMQYSIFRDSKNDMKLYKFDVTFGNANRQITSYVVASSVSEANTMIVNKYENAVNVSGELVATVTSELVSTAYTDLLIDN